MPEDREDTPFDDAPTEADPAPSDADRPTVTLDPAVAQAEVGLSAGESVGPYKLLEVVGVGGFGVVWLAEQKEPIRRRVALKVIKPGMDSAAVVARFEAERNALSVMDHPNIARVLDGGTTERGLPYFVMEHVPGEPITAYCDRHKLGLNERLEVFGQVCQAVQHAHAKGVIHRDLKPSNILVREVDDKPVAKVIDFGVAKALDQRLSAHTLFTADGHVVGTPDYMAPEQADGSGRDIDARADVYSLGVVLYELLTGERPFDFKKVAFIEIGRMIAEVEPPKPSTRVRTAGERTTSGARASPMQQATVVRALRRDLDWLVLRCLEKDRKRRYDSVSALYLDIDRFLRDEPLMSGPPSVWYRVSKIATRYRFFLGSSAAVFGLLASAVVITATALDRAQTERDRLERVVEFFDEEIFRSDRLEGAGTNATVQSVLEDAAERVDTTFTQDVMVSERLLASLGRALVHIGQEPTAVQAFDRASDYSNELARALAGDPEAPDWAWQAAMDFAAALWRSNEAPRALAFLERIEDDTLGRHRRAELWLQLGSALRHSTPSRLAEARAAYAESRRIASIAPADTLAVADAEYNAALALADEASMTENESERARLHGDAIDLLKNVEAIRTRELGPDHPRSINAGFAIATYAARAQRFGESEAAFDRVIPAYSRALGRSHWRTLEATANYGSMHVRRARTLEESDPEAAAVDYVRAIGHYNRYLIELDRQGRLDDLDASRVARFLMAAATRAELLGEEPDRELLERWAALSERDG